MINERTATKIIAAEGMGPGTVGPVESLVLVPGDDGLDLADDMAREPADLSSADAFRRQVRRWKIATGRTDTRILR